MADDKSINWAYPFPGKGAEIGPLQYLTHMAKANGGHYPTGENGLWHGGVHFDQGTAAVFDQSSVRCIADGEVIAYRIDDSYPISEYTDDIPRIRRAAFSTGFVLVKHGLRPPQAQASSEQSPPTLMLYSLYMHLQDWTGYRSRQDLPRPAFWAGDTYVVDTQNGDLIVRAQPAAGTAELARLAKGTQVRVRSVPGEYHKLVAILGGTTHTELVPGDDGELPGYVASKYLSMQSEPQATDRVVVLDTPLPIEAGDLIGHPGSYQNQDGPAQPLLHLEVFSCDDVPGFIAQSRTWANRLPDDQKTLLKVYKGASKLIAHRDDINADNPPRLSDSGSQVGVDLIIPQAHLDGLPAANRIQIKTAIEGSTTASTTHWWRLDGLFANQDGNPIDGWLAEQDLITTRHSPWEWPDFQCVEDTGSPLDKLAYAFNAKGMLNTEEQHNYRAQISKTDGGPILALARLYDIVDSDRDGVLTSSEIRAALAKPWHAQMLGRLIARYESEWFWNKSKWDELDPLLAEEPGKPNPAWEVEKQRIEKLSWWRELAGKHGISGDGKAWHMSPIQTTGIFKAEKIFSFTLNVMQFTYPELAQDRNSDLLEIADELNRYILLYKLDTPLRRTHFFAQILQETGPQLRIEERFNWKAESLIQTFRYFRNNPEAARQHGYEVRPGIKADGTRMTRADFEAIANGAYGGRADLGNGDYATGDGWRYRGRGLKQLTGRYNYEALTRWHNRLIENWPEENVDFVENPDLLLTIKYAVRSAANFWVSNKLYELADNGAELKIVDSITEAINKETDSYPQRRANFKRLWEARVFE
ncbi:hypothetical protein [Pseudomonas lopnurensis]|uniref:hypothetical protein n=1 Tax=Pseudomonas lopnurensis TaxID=1477517 RepID=UPI0028A8C274|nr:hypothetical protein [Pseudomonas lopnurensis]